MWKLLKAILFFTSFMFIFACENNIGVISNLENAKELPVLSAKNSEIIYSDSGKIKMKIISAEMLRFVNTERTYILFPKGITVYQYDTALNIVSSIQANRAVFNENEKKWEAFGNVIVKNIEKNEELTSEELIWDQNKRIIFSTKFTTIINNDGVFYGDGGFNANDDMSKWEMIGIKGKVNIKENTDAP